MASVSEAMLLWEVSCAGSSRSADDDNDPRLIEQPQSTIAINATGAVTLATHATPEQKRVGPGMAIDTEHSRVDAVLVARHAEKCIGQNNDAGTSARVSKTKTRAPRPAP